MVKNKKIIEQLTLEQKAALTAGASEWQTYPVKNKVPQMFLSDGPFGLRKQAGKGDHLGLNASVPATCFPTTATMANSWNPKLTEKVGEAVAREDAEQDVDQSLGPALNIKRNPRGGRSFEYFSEDPYLAGKMAAGLIRGLQKNGKIATPKHYTGNSQETRRMAYNSVIDERALREIYTTNFEIAVKEGKPKAIMSAYNMVNGAYANENKHLLTDILRKEFGFQGYVVTDWGGDNDHVAGLKAGSNLEMPGVGPLAAKAVVKAVKDGKLDEKVLDQRVDEFLTVALAAKKAKKNKNFSWEKQHAIARDVAKKCFVLLKNDKNVLPLAKDTKVALIGDFAKHPRYQGAGSSIINSHDLENMVDTAKNYPLDLIGYAQGYHRVGGIDEQLEKEAVALAEKSDVVVLNIGLDEGSESEGLDRPNIKMPQNQLHLLDQLAATGKKIVVVLSAGSVTEMSWTKEADAVLHEYLGGEAGASAVWEVLTGKYNPSGRLNETYPMHESDIPFNKEFAQDKPNIYYKESIFVGYRYYDTAKVPVRYPFGYGLSYTSFEINDLQINDDGVTVKVTNTGKRNGSETVQLYVGKKDSPLIRAAKELKGFTQVNLDPGESKQVKIPFDDKTFRYFDVQTNSWQQEKGTYQIMIGKNVENIVCQGKYELKNGTVPEVKKTSAYRKYKKADLSAITNADFEKLYGKKLPQKEFHQGMPMQLDNTLSDLKYCNSWVGRKIERWLKKNIDQSIAASKPNLNFLFNYNMPFRAMSKITCGLVDLPMTNDILLIVNGHFWRGLGRVIRDYFRNSRANKNTEWYHPSLEGKK